MCVLDRRAGRPQLGPVGHLADHPRPAWPGSSAVALPRLRRSWVSASASRAATGNGSLPCRCPMPARRRRQPQERAHDVPSRSRPGSRPGARCARRCAAGTARRRCAAGRTSRRPRRPRRRVSSTRAHLVGQHRGRGVGVLHRERAAEAAALLGAGQLDQVEPADLAQQPQRLVADPQHPQRVAGRVVGDPVRVRGADVGHPEHVDQQLRQLVGPRRHRRRPVGQPASPASPGHRACWCRTDPTHDPDGATTASYGSKVST